MSMFSRIRRKDKTSREVAKQRLQLVLVHDRNRISPGLLEILKDEIIAVISKHIEIDTKNVHVSISQEEKESRLMADIPLAEGGHLRGSI